jgi:hypothetical protein
LELHAGKTRLIEFGRHAARNRERRGEGKPETFTFLGYVFSALMWWKSVVSKRSVRTPLLSAT